MKRWGIIKRVIAFAVSLALISGVVPDGVVPVARAAANPTTWEELKTAMAAGGEITLDRNITHSEYDDMYIVVPAGETVTLDLNGHTVDGDQNGSVITVKGTLVLKDTAGGGNITGGSSGSGGGICVEPDNGSNASFTMNSGCISGNGSEEGGGVYVAGGATFTMNGGSIEHNFGGQHGGGVYVAGGATFRMNGGSITHNGVENGSGKIGGGVYCDNSISLSGHCVIKDNGDTNVYLKSSCYIYVTDDLDDETYVGVTGEDQYSNTVITQGLSGHGSVDNFFSDDRNKGIIEEDGEAVFGTETSWKKLKKNIEKATGSTISIELDGDVEADDEDSTINITEGKRVTIDLKGNTINGRNKVGSLFEINGGSLTINDTGSGGELIGGNGDNGGAVYQYSGSFTMNGGSIAENHAGYYGGAVYIDDGDFTMNGGSIAGNIADFEGGAVYIDDGIFTMTAGEIKNNSAPKGGGVYISDYGSFIMKGGSIESNKADEQGGGVFYKGGSFSLSGSPVIGNNTVSDISNNVYLEYENVLTIAGALSSTASISINAGNYDPEESRIYGWEVTDGLSGNGSIDNFSSDYDSEKLCLAYDGEVKILTENDKHTISVNDTADWLYDSSINYTDAFEGTEVIVRFSLNDGYDVKNVEYSIGYYDTREATYVSGSTGGIYVYKFTMPDDYVDVTINATRLMSCEGISAELSGFIYYTGSGLKDTICNYISVYDDAYGIIPLDADTHYTVTSFKKDGKVVADPVEIGTYTAVITGIPENGYSGSKEFSFTVDKGLYGEKEVSGKAKAGTAGTVDLYTVLDSGYESAEITSSLTDESILSSASIDNGKLNFAFKNGVSAGDSERVEITVVSTNYEDYTITATFTVTEKDVPVVIVEPITATYSGQPIGSSMIRGTATVGDTPVEGNWTFRGGTTFTNVADSGIKTVIFTPSNMDAYETVETTLALTINRASVSGSPIYTKITTSGKNLGDATLELGTLSPDGGVIAWDDPVETVVTQGTAYGWTYSPGNNNYQVKTGSIVLWENSGSGGSGNSGDSGNNGDSGNDGGSGTGSGNTGGGSYSGGGSSGGGSGGSGSGSGTAGELEPSSPTPSADPNTGAEPVPSSAPAPSAGPAPETSPTPGTEPGASPAPTIVEQSTETVNNPDGSTTTTTTTLDSEGTRTTGTETVRKDGTVEVTSEVLKNDGSTEKTTELTKPDGTVEKTGEIRNADGSTEDSRETIKPDGSSVKTVDIVRADNTTVHEDIRTTATGRETSRILETAPSGNTILTEQVTQPSGDFSKVAVETTYKKDENGNILGVSITIQTEQKTGNITQKASFEVLNLGNTKQKPSFEAMKTGNSSTKFAANVSQMKTVALKELTTTSKSGEIIIPKTVKADGEIYTVTVLEKGLLKGNKKKPKKLLIKASGITKIAKGTFKNLAKKATILIKANKKDFKRIRNLVRKSGIGKGVKIHKA